LNKNFISCLLLSISISIQSIDTISLHRDKKNDDFDIDKYLNIDKSQTILRLTKPIIISPDNSSFDNISNFTFQENIIYEPDTSYNYDDKYINHEAVFIINKDNTTIDLNGFSLAFDVESNVQICGITIMPGIKNTKIISSTSLEKKGCITGFPKFAISILGDNTNFNDLNISDDLMIKYPLIKNILIVQNKSGISIINAVHPTISNTNIIYNSTSEIIYGIFFHNVIDGVVDSCKINNNFSTNDVYGIQLLDTIGTIIENSEIKFNRSTTSGNTTGINIAATSPKKSIGNTIENCKSSGNLCAYTENKESVGFYINYPSHHNIIKNSTSLAQSHNFIPVDGMLPTNPPLGYGIKINNSPHNNLINNQSSYNNGCGFHDSLAPSSSLYFENSAFLNKKENYSVFIANSLHPGYLHPLPTKILYQDIVSSTNQFIDHFNNIEIK